MGRVVSKALCPPAALRLTGSCFLLSRILALKEAMIETSLPVLKSQRLLGLAEGRPLRRPSLQGWLLLMGQG